MASQVSYRTSHSAPGYGIRYRRNYERGYYAALWHEIERPLLLRLVREYGSGKDKTCLDFACGTGRIAGAIAAEYGNVVGVDVSAAMLAEAQVPANVTLLRVDLTRESLRRQFDAATAFRFFLNAEESLRRRSLIALAASLKPGAPLICNIHMSPTSPMGMMYRVGAAVTGRTIHKVLGRDDFLQLLSETGFSAECVHAYGYLPRPGHYLPRLCEKLIAPVERLSRRFHIPEQWAQSILVVARRVDDAGVAGRHA